MIKSFLQTTEWLDFQQSIGHKTWRFDDGKIRANIIQHKVRFGKNYLYIPHGPEVEISDAYGKEKPKSHYGAGPEVEISDAYGNDKPKSHYGAGPEVEISDAYGNDKPKSHYGAGPEILLTKNFQAQLKNEVDNFLRYLKDLAKENKSIFVKMEPLSDVVVETVLRKGIKRSKKQLQPYKTVIVDLNLSEEEILSRMHHKTRYNIKVADKHGITVKQNDDLDVFWKLLKKTSKRDKFYSHTKDYYQKLLDTFKNNGELKTELFLTYSGDSPVAGAIIMRYGDTGYYLHGASDHEARSLMASYALHWNIITYLKARGLHYYDLWGIDARKWPGVTRFKLGWLGSPKPTGEGGGDRMVEYPGSFDFVISKFWYIIYNVARKLF